MDSEAMDLRATKNGSSRPVPIATGESELIVFLHDLNNLLGIVMGNAELLLDVGTNDDKRIKRTQAIHTAATKAAELVVGLQGRIG